MRGYGLDGLSQLLYINFLSLIDKESVLWVSPAITVHTLRKKGEIKTVSVLTRLPSSQVTWCILNWLNGWDRENIFGVDCWNGCTHKLQRKGVLMGIVRMILWKSKRGIGRWKLTKVEERIFGGDCRGGCVHN